MNPWDALKQYEQQQRQAQVSRKAQVSEQEECKKKQSEELLVRREMERRQVEQNQIVQRQLEEQQANERQQHRKSDHATILMQTAGDLRIDSQQRQDTLQKAVEKMQQEQQSRPKGSPIEAMFQEAWQAAYPSIELQHQYPVLKYRVDFAHVESKVAIELDGQDFHSRKKDRNKDNERQYAIEDEGWYFIRFTGSKVWSDVDSCVARVYKIISERVAW